MQEPCLVADVNLSALLKRTIAFLAQHSSGSRKCVTDSATLQTVLAILDVDEYNGLP